MSSRTAKTPSRKTRQKKLANKGKRAFLPAKGGFLRRNRLQQELVNAALNESGLAHHEIVVGEVTLRAVIPPEEVVRANIVKAQKQLAVALADVARPGFKMKKRKDVAYFRADPGDPHILIRELNGNIQRGVVEHGKFIEVS